MGTTKRLAYLGGIYSMGSLFEKGLAFFLIPIYTTYLSTADYGIIGLISVAVELVNKFVMAVDSGFIRFYDSPKYAEKKGLLLFNCFLCIALQAACLAVPFYLFRANISGLLLDDTAMAGLVGLYALILFMNPISGFLEDFVRQEERAFLFIVASWASFIVSVTVILLGLLRFDLGVYALVYGKLSSLCTRAIFFAPFFWRRAVPKVSLAVLKEPYFYGFPLIVQKMSNLLIHSGDRYVLRFFSALSVVGVYSFGYSFAGLVDTVLVAPLKKAFKPMLLKQETDLARLRSFTKDSCTRFYMLAMFFCLVLSVYSQDVIRLMARKEEFWSSWVIVPLIAFSYVQNGLGSFFNAGLVMAKKPRTISLNVLIAASVNIGLNFAFIPVMGYLGAAVATLVSFFAWNALKLHGSAKYFDVRFDLKRLFLITAIGTSLYVISLAGGLLESLVASLAVKTLVLSVYVVLVFVLVMNDGEKEYANGIWRQYRLNGARVALRKMRD